MKKIIVFFIALISAFGFLACTTEENIPAAKELNQIVVSSMPKKLLFSVGDSFTADGLELSAYYSDGTVSVIKSNEYQITPSSGSVLEKESENETVKIVCQKQEISYSIIIRKKSEQKSDSSSETEINSSDYSVLYDFDEENKTASVKGIDGTASIIEIPETLNGIYTVEKISPFAFMNCTFLTEVKFPESLKEIGVQAFTNCTSLQTVILPEGLKKIGYNAFGGCGNIQYFEVNCSDIEYIPSEGLFQRLGKNDYPFITVSKIVFTDKVKKVRSNLWSGNFLQMRVEGPETVLENQAFYNCSPGYFYCNTQVPEELFFSFWGELELTENVKKVGRLAFVCSGAFVFADKTYAATLPDSIEEIDEAAFSGYPIKNLPKNLKRMEEGAFCGSLAMKEVVFPENIEYIGRGVFEECDKIEKVVFPKYFENIEIAGSIFLECKNLKTVRFEGNICFQQFDSSPDVEFAEGVTLFNGVYDNENIVEYTVPEGIEEIPNSCLSVCENLKSIKFPSTLKKIGDAVLSYCPALEKIEFDENSSGIEIGNLFLSMPENGESKIESYHFPKYVTKIGINFSAGRNLKSFTSESLPVKSYSVTTDENGKNTYNFVFGNPGVTTIEEESWFGPVFPYFHIEEEEANINYSYEEGVEVIETLCPRPENGVYDKGKNTTLKFPSTLKKIGGLSCIGIKEVEIPDSVEYIEGFGSDSLETVKISDNSSLKYIESGAFSGCQIKEFNLPKSLEYIGPAAFYENCTITKFTSKASCDFDIERWTTSGSRSTEIKLEQNNIYIQAETSECSLSLIDDYFSGSVEGYAIILHGEVINSPLTTTKRVKVVCVDSDVKKIGLMLPSQDVSVPVVFRPETPPVFYGTDSANALLFDSSEKIYVPDESLEFYKSVYTWGKDRITGISELPNDLKEML